MLDAVPKDEKPAPIQGMDCLVIGGCANGQYIKNIRLDAEFIEVKRDIGLKPLASSIQKIPELIRESDQYEVHPIGLHNTPDKLAVFSLAVVRGRSLTWGFMQLVEGYVKYVTTEMLAAGVITKQ